MKKFLVISGGCVVGFFVFVLALGAIIAACEPKPNERFEDRRATATPTEEATAMPTRVATPTEDATVVGSLRRKAQERANLLRSVKEHDDDLRFIAEFMAEGVRAG